jgi:ribosomal protein L4
VIDVQPQDAFALGARNIAGVRLVPSARVTARDVMDTSTVVATRQALEKLQEWLGSPRAAGARAEAGTGGAEA